MLLNSRVAPDYQLSILWRLLVFLILLARQAGSNAADRLVPPSQIQQNEVINAAPMQKGRCVAHKSTLYLPDDDLLCRQNDIRLPAGCGSVSDPDPSRVGARWINYPKAVEGFQVIVYWEKPKNMTGVIGYRVSIRCARNNHFHDAGSVDMFDVNTTLVYFDTNLESCLSARKSDHRGKCAVSHIAGSSQYIASHTTTLCTATVLSLPLPAQGVHQAGVNFKIPSCRAMGCPNYNFSTWNPCLKHEDNYDNIKSLPLCICLPLAPSNFSLTYNETNRTLLAAWNISDKDNVPIRGFWIWCRAASSHCFPGVIQLPGNARFSPIGNLVIVPGVNYTISIKALPFPPGNSPGPRSYQTFVLPLTTPPPVSGTNASKLTVKRNITSTDHQNARPVSHGNVEKLALIASATGGLSLLLIVGVFYFVRQQRKDRKTRGTAVLTPTHSPISFRGKLQTHLPRLLELLDFNFVLEYFSQEQCQLFSDDHRQSILSPANARESRERLVEALMTGSEDDYRLFLDALEANGQHSLYGLLEDTQADADLQPESHHPPSLTTESHRLPSLTTESSSTSFESDATIFRNAIAVQSPVTVYVTYARWPKSHEDQVRHLCINLHSQGVHAVLDQFRMLELADEPASWVSEQMSHCDHIIVVLSEHYPLCLGKEDRSHIGRAVKEYHLSSLEVDLLQGSILSGRRNFIIPVYLGEEPLPFAVPELFQHRTLYILNDTNPSSDWDKLIYRLYRQEMYASSPQNVE